MKCHPLSAPRFQMAKLVFEWWPCALSHQPSPQTRVEGGFITCQMLVSVANS